MALKLNPESAECHFNIATAYMETNQLHSALIHYETSLQFNPSNAECHYELGRISLHVNTDFELKRAEQFFLKAIQLNPKHLKAHSALRELLAKNSIVSQNSIVEEAKEKANN